MNEALPVDLIYGHTGEGNYDEQRHEWTFNRVPGTCSHFEVVNQPVSVVKGEATWSSSSSKPTAHSRSQSIKKLLAAYPQFASGSPSIGALAQESETFEEVTSTQDAFKSELLAFGDVAVVGPTTSGTKTIPVAAVVGGIAGNTLRIIRMNQKRLDRRGDTDTHVELSTLENGIESSWKRYDGPIQQLCFAKATKGRETWLAVRCQVTVDVIPLSINAEGNVEGLGLQLDHGLGLADELLELDYSSLFIPVGRTGGFPHVDVSFNPWNPQQLALLDRKGHWSVWSLEQRVQRKGLWEAILKASGHLHTELSEGQEASDASNDEWGRITWLGNARTVLVAARSVLATISFSDPPRQMNIQGISSKQPEEIILEVKRSTFDLDQIFLLTSTRILWLRYHVQEDPGGLDVKAHAHILLSWKHFRDPTDLSLKLSIAGFLDANGLLLYSSINENASFFAFRMSAQPAEMAVSVCDPCSVPLRALYANGSGIHGLKRDMNYCAALTIALDSGNHIKRKRKRQVEYEFDDITTKTQIYRLSVLRADFSVSECVIAVGLGKIANPAAHPGEREFLGIRRIIKESYDNFKYETKGSEQEDFELVRDVKSDLTRRSHSRPVKEDPWTLNMEWIRSEIQAALEDKTILFSAFIKSIRRSIEQDSFDDPSLPKLLTQFNVGDILVKDIDRATNEFIDLLGRVSKTSSIDEAEITEVEPCIGTLITPALTRAIGIGGELVPASLYDNLVGLWIGSLPLNSSGQARIAVERRIRSIAAQLCLASYHYPFHESRLDDHSMSKEPLELREVVLPLRRKASNTALPRKEKGKAQDVHRYPPTSPRASGDRGSLESGSLRNGAVASSPTRALPTPEPTPSLHSQSSFSSTTLNESAASGRLGLVVTILPQPQVTDSTSNILSRWAIGDDPWSYEWDSRQQARDMKERKTVHGPTARSQVDVRPQKRRKHEPEDSYSQQAPIIIVGSQPQIGQDLDTQGSSMMTQPLVTMSQVEPGIHGSRKKNTAKGNTNKRVAGFK